MMPGVCVIYAERAGPSERGGRDRNTSRGDQASARAGTVGLRSAMYSVMVVRALDCSHLDGTKVGGVSQRMAGQIEAKSRLV